MTQTLRLMLQLLCALALLTTTGCSDSSDNGGDAGDGDGDTGDGDTGDGDGDGDMPTVTCGADTCETTADDSAWGAVACCVPGGGCGVKSDAPSIANPLNQQPIPVTQIIAGIQSMDPMIAAQIKDTDPKIDCLAKNQPGTESDQCPDFELMMQDADAGAGGMMLSAVGCCRPDGSCGYIDDTGSIGGCVKISDSLLGKVFGTADESCTP